MIYFVIYILVGTALLLLSHDEFLESTHQNNMRTPAEQALCAVVGILLWPAFTAFVIWKCLRGDE